MLIRLLQHVSEIQLRQQEANPEAVPPPGWAESLLSDDTDKVLFKGHLTMFVQVSCIVLVLRFFALVLTRCLCRAQGGLWVTMRTEDVEASD